MAGHADAGGWCRLTFARAVIQGQKKARSGSGLFSNEVALAYSPKLYLIVRP